MVTCNIRVCSQRSGPRGESLNITVLRTTVIFFFWGGGEGGVNHRWRVFEKRVLKKKSEYLGLKKD